MPHILIIEDDTDINNAVAEYLTARGCRCTQAFSGTEGRLYWKQGGADLIIADLMLPGLTGQQLLAGIRGEDHSSVPVIVLSARTALQDKVELLELGADDYLTKPFSLQELWLRVGVQLRHAGAAATQPSHIQYKDWSIDPETRTLTVKGGPVALTLARIRDRGPAGGPPQKGVYPAGNFTNPSGRNRLLWRTRPSTCTSPTSVPSCAQPVPMTISKRCGA